MNLRYSTILFLAVFLVSCDQQERPQVFGYLYFTAGSHVGRFNLETGTTSVLGSVGDGTAVQLSEYKANKLLLTVQRRVNRQSVTRIEEFDVRTDHVSTRFLGRTVHYLPTSQQIVFDDGNALVSVRDTGHRPEISTIYKHHYRAIAAVVPISGDDLLFSYDDNDTQEYFRFGGQDHSLTRLDSLGATCSLAGAVWLAGRKVLACRLGGISEAAGAYHLVALDGTIGQKLSLPRDRKFRAIAYLANQDALILIENSSGEFDGQEKTAVWIHNIESGESTRIFKNDYFGSSIIYKTT